MLHIEEGQKENSAVRIHRIFERMMGAQPENTATMLALYAAAGFDSKVTPFQQTQELSRVVTLLFNELDCMIEELKPKHSLRAFRPILNAFERLAPAQMVSRWDQNKPIFQAALPLLFSFGEELENEGSPIPAKELAEVQNAVKEFRQEVLDSDWQKQLKRFMLEQLDFILRAITDYPIAGVKAFKSSAREMYFHQAEHIELVRQHKDSEPMTRLQSFQATIVKWSRYAIELGKLLAAVDSIEIHGEKALHAAAEAVSDASSVIHNLK
jgi:hypothetical protein